jgi:hypothetical protein
MMSGEPGSSPWYTPGPAKASLTRACSSSRGQSFFVRFAIVH